MNDIPLNGRLRTYVFVMIAPYIMRQFMTKDFSDIVVKSKSIISVCPYTKLDLLTGIHIKTKKAGAFMRSKFSQEANGEIMPLHDMKNSWIIGQLVK